MGEKLTRAGLELRIAKGWKPNMVLSNMAMAFFQEPSFYVAPDIFPMLPVQTSIGNYYEFSKAELAKDQFGRKPAFGKVDPAVFTHDTKQYTTEVDQLIIGIDQIAALNYQRAGAPATIDPRRANTRLATEQAKMHLDNTFAKGFFNPDVWGNLKTGDATGSASNSFQFFSDANMDIIEYFDDLKREILLNGRRLPNRLTLGYDAFIAMKNHPQFLNRVVSGGSTPNPAKVNEAVIASVLGIDTVKVLYSTQNVAPLGQEAKMEFVFNTNDALLSYAPATPSLEEPSAGYIITWDMLGTGAYMTSDSFEGEGGTHSEFTETLLCTSMKKTCDDLAIYLHDVSEKKSA